MVIMAGRRKLTGCGNNAAIMQWYVQWNLEIINGKAQIFGRGLIGFSEEEAWKKMLVAVKV